MIGKNKEKEFECFEDKDDSLENTLDLNPKKNMDGIDFCITLLMNMGTAVEVFSPPQPPNFFENFCFD